MGYDSSHVTGVLGIVDQTLISTGNHFLNANTLLIAA
ncbi:hypothetical protein HALLA_04395 (plasmid) [Halostagnicola larsenii XH-48]|uniref:Uncharacterized protein n=1 Tax=Halostagnicola larsenii XH-48 TaxID=797299 RepID=W0JWN0_9EURY|nr:hypothetical protein HALLA_04395 [Halostagnicola larsenii XH-48]